MTTDTDHVDYFVSHASIDERWAVWVAEVIRASGFSVRLDVWHWAPGSDIIREMEIALETSKCVVTIWTPAYFTHQYSSLELRAAFARSLQDRGQLLPIIAEPCDVPELYGTLLRLNLVGVDEHEAKEILRTGLQETRLAANRRSAVGIATSVDVGYPGRSQIWNIPPRNINFTGRDSLMAEIADGRNGPYASGNVCTLHGLGGVGKSRLAIEYAYAHSEDLKIGWWISSEFPAEIPAALASLAIKIGLSTKDAGSAVDAVLEYLRVESQWLIIFDNATSSDDLAGFLPTGQGQVIVTSRNPVWGSLGRRLKVDVLTSADSAVLLRKRIRVNDELGWELGRELGGLPLAIQQVSALLEQTALPPAEFLDILKANRDEVLSTMPANAGEDTIVKVWSLSIDAILRESQASVQMLRIASLFGPEAIPVELIRESSSYLPTRLRRAITDPAGTITTFATIAGFSLGRYSGGSLYLHRLVQAAVRIEMSARMRSAYGRRVRQILRNAEPGDPNDPPTWARYNILFAHLSTSPAIDVPRSSTFRRITLNALWALYCQGQHGAAIKAAVTIRESFTRRLGNHHPDVLTSINHQAAAQYALGNYFVARELHETALAGRRHNLGPQHLDTLGSVTGLAITLNALGEYDSAIQLHREAFIKYQELYGADHLDTLRSATSLANALTNAGDYSVAEDLHRDTLNRRLRLLPPKHPAISRSMNNLADTLLRRGDFTAARELFRSCLDDRLGYSSPTHPDTLNSAAGLAETLTWLGDLEQADEMHRDVLAIRTEVYGTGTTVYVRSLAAISELHYLAGDFAKARLIAAEGADAGRYVFSNDHCLVNRCEVSRLAALVQLGQLEEAQRVLDESVEPHLRSCKGDCRHLRLWLAIRDDPQLSVPRQG